MTFQQKCRNISEIVENLTLANSFLKLQIQQKALQEKLFEIYLSSGRKLAKFIYEIFPGGIMKLRKLPIFILAFLIISLTALTQVNRATGPDGGGGSFTADSAVKSLQVIYPGYNTSQIKGGICNIQWFSRNIKDSYIKLGYRRVKNGVLSSAETIDVRAVNKNGRNSYSWEIPEKMNDGDYKIIISTVDNHTRAEGNVFHIIDKETCDLAIAKAEFCSGNLNIIIMNYGRSYIGDISFILQYKQSADAPAPLTLNLQKKKFILFTRKTLKISFKNLPALNRFSEKFNLVLIPARGQKDTNDRNNRYSGTVYRSCAMRNH